MHAPLPYLVHPPWSTTGKKLESMVRRALYDFKMLDQAEAVAVALSGGKDSLSLLLLLKAILGRGFPPLPLYAIHVQGEFSCGAGVAESHLREICNVLDVPLTIRVSHQKKESLECYSCSRERRSLLFETCRQIPKCVLAFGHHRDDHAQTLLMNLLHKGEFAGNLPKLEMYDYGITLIRPLIYVPEDNIRTFAKQQGIQRVTCRCPVGQNSKRRQTEMLLQEIEQTFPNARSNLAQAGLIYGSQKAALPTKRLRNDHEE